MLHTTLDHVFNNHVGALNRVHAEKDLLAVAKGAVVKVAASKTNCSDSLGLECHTPGS